MALEHLLYAGPLLSLALLWTVAVVTPGPNFFTTAQLAASCSRRHGMIAALGVATGTVLWGWPAAWGSSRCSAPPRPCTWPSRSPVAAT